MRSHLHFWFLFLPVVCPLFSGCKSVVYGSALTSAAVASELIRYTLPELVGIDRIEVTEYHSATIDSKFLDYYEALIPTPISYSSTLDDPANYWTVPVRSTGLKKPRFPSPRASSSAKVRVITDPQSVSEFVGIFNANLTLWLNYIDIVPRPVHPYSYEISFYSQNALVRTVGFRNSVLSTIHESKSVIRRLSDADTGALGRVLSKHMAQ